MRSVPRGVLLLAALALPVVAVLISFALTGGARAPEVPETVRVGSSPGPSSPGPAIPVVPGPSDLPPPAELPPPAPNDDADDDDDATDGHDD
ncbi:hypothetical protein [Saccharopolyspora dendranthemae]|uniref:Small secreted hydrophilic protein n=1 Tax=Saccharopolyspora dendranthemae TaxID=1181886 RepID=A0A561U594_9PSEU|nr:hypothetical protein [Saccharopolyspora dendranthemae]TWF94532.1 hypothetical protein FHU35_13244 [Saccharopolyspora dendranthemae]